MPDLGDFASSAIAGSAKRNPGASVSEILGPRLPDFGDLGDRPFQARNADAILLRAVVGHQPYPHINLQRAYDALAPGGFMQVQTWETIPVQVNPEWPKAKQDLARAIEGRRDAMVNAYKYSEPSINILYGAELTKALKRLPKDRVPLRNDVERITGPLHLFMETMVGGPKNTDLQQRLELLLTTKTVLQLTVG